MVDRRAGRKIEAPPHKLIRRFRVVSEDAALSTVLPGCMPLRLYDNECTVLLSCWVSFYLFPALQSCSSLGHGLAETPPPVTRIFFSEYVRKVIRRFKFVKANMICAASAGCDVFMAIFTTRRGRWFRFKTLGDWCAALPGVQSCLP